MVTLEVIAGSTAFTLFSYYFEPSKNIESDLHKISQVFSSKSLNRLVWSMDSNSKSELWFSLYSDARENKLSEFISTNNLLIINEDCCPSFRATQVSSSDLEAYPVTTYAPELGYFNLNNGPAEIPLVRFIKMKERYEARHQDTVSYMRLKSTDNDLHTSAVCNDQFRGRRSDTIRQVALETTYGGWWNVAEKKN
ncbi:hypothetical protein TNCV_4506311 [Trichonephila clavipes]|nr:hypothetical protein TNCV_4506311 [Trichonephila clavipes]